MTRYFKNPFFNGGRFEIKLIIWYNGSIEYVFGTGTKSHYHESNVDINKLVKEAEYIEVPPEEAFLLL